MSTPTYRIGQAAKILESSSHRLRALCAAGMVEAELTASGQWRIPVEEVTRLTKEGLPPIPRAQPDPEAEPAPAAPGQIGPEPDESPEVRAERDGLMIAEHRLKRRKIELEEQGVEDAFEERERRRQAEATEAASRRAVAAAAATRKQWEERIIEHALRSLPYGCPPELRLQSHGKLMEVLQPLAPDSSPSLVQKVTEAAAEATLQPYLENERRAAAIHVAARTLPVSAWDSDWEVKARRHAAEALHAHTGPTDQATLNQVARAAVSATVRECEHAARLQKAANGIAYWRLGQATDRERAEVLRAGLDSLNRLPIGASPVEIDQAKEKALRPFERALDARVQAGRRKEEAQSIAERAVELLRSHLSTGWEWDSYAEQAETARHMAEELRPLIQQKYIAGSIDHDELQEYVEEWAAARLAEEEDEPD